MIDSYDYKKLQKWEDYNREWFLYKMDKTRQAIGSCGPYNNPCITCRYSNCAFCPIVRRGDSG